MKVLKKYWILFCIILAFIIVILIITKIISDRNNLDGSDTQLRDFVVEEMEATKGKIQNVSSISDYELARVCIQKFYTYYSQIYDENIINASDDIEFNLNYYKEKLYELFTDEYIQNHEITKENIDTKLEKNDYDLVEIYNIYYVTNYENVKVFFVKGLVRNSETLESKEYEVTLYIDNITQNFKINLDNILNKDYSQLEIGSEVEYVIPDTIRGSNVNRFTYPSITYDEFGKIIFNNIRNLLLYNPEKAYEKLYESEKTKFKDVNSLIEFIDSNRRDIFLLTYRTYEINYENEKFTMYLYDDNAKYIITAYLDTFSDFKFKIEEI